ncbi:hypothetical protein [Photobacterium salinisoli]|uniref:hypothetical protein n=1 Tax=Photobacterium salinisoli TaxID=1616783 RepID=UPI000EA355FC|nr:hypothetical protein [Photobacterium salinisoli]
MPHFFRRQFLAHWALLLTVWVVFVCLSKNTAVLALCPYQPVEAVQIFSASDMAEPEAQASSSDCDLSEQLLQLKYQQLDTFFLIPILLLTLMLAGLLGAGCPSPPLCRDPKVPKRRIHLTLCIFRE